MIIATLPENGTLTLNGDAVLAGQSIAVGDLGGLVWTPPANANGNALASFTFQVVDNSGAPNIDPTPNTMTFNVANINDAPTGTVTITGTALEGGVLTASHALSDADGLGSISYQWQRNGVDIGDATGATYALTQGDVGASITVVASYIDGQGTAESVTSVSSDAIADLIIGGKGNDTLHGNDGNDNIQGNDGNDTMFGGTGNDTMFGGNGKDTVHGDDGNDNIQGNEGNDTLFGDRGDDFISGGNGNDIAHGGTGNDTLSGGAGIDTLTGGEGYDQFVLDTSLSNIGKDKIEDFEIGSDKIVLSNDVFTQIDANGALSAISSQSTPPVTPGMRTTD